MYSLSGKECYERKGETKGEILKSIKRCSSKFDLGLEYFRVCQFKRLLTLNCCDLGCRNNLIGYELKTLLLQKLSPLPNPLTKLSEISGTSWLSMVQMQSKIEL